jgi:hypothetical protein
MFVPMKAYRPPGENGKSICCFPVGTGGVFWVELLCPLQAASVPAERVADTAGFIAEMRKCFVLLLDCKETFHEIDNQEKSMR